MVWSDTIIKSYIFPAYFCSQFDSETIFIAYLLEQISGKGQRLRWIIISSIQQLAHSLAILNPYTTWLFFSRSLLLNPGYRIIVFI